MGTILAMPLLAGQAKETDWDARAYPHNLALVKRLAETCDWEALCAREYGMAYDIKRTPK